MKTGLFRAIRKRLSLVHDNEAGAFREKLGLLVEQKDKLSDDDIKAKVDELKSLCLDLPESEDKAQLERFLDDFTQVKEQDAKVAKAAADKVSELFEKLDSEALSDVPAEKTEDADCEEKAEGEKVADGDKMEIKETKDEEKNPSLEEIFEYVKKRLSEETSDSEETVNEVSTEEVSDEETKEEEGEEAPSIPVTMATNDNAMKGGLADLFNSIKGRR